MQENADGRNKDASTPNAKASERVLEDPRQIERDGKLVATLYDLISSFEPDENDGLIWRKFLYRRLMWSPLSAILKLQGATLQNLLGPNFLVLKGTHFPAYYEQPGMENVELVEIIANPNNRTPLDVFNLLFVDMYQPGV